MDPAPFLGTAGLSRWTSCGIQPDAKPKSKPGQVRIPSKNTTPYSTSTAPPCRCQLHCDPLLYQSSTVESTSLRSSTFKARRNVPIDNLSWSSILLRFVPTIHITQVSTISQISRLQSLRNSTNNTSINGD